MSYVRVPDNKKTFKSKPKNIFLQKKQEEFSHNYELSRLYKKQDKKKFNKNNPHR